MAKQKTRFICQECGAVFPKMMGHCYHCDTWGRVVEEAKPTDSRSPTPPGGVTDPVPLSHIDSIETARVKTGISEFDRVTGGGIVPGSIILIGGSPGIGKSTLLLEVGKKIADNTGENVLYVTGEESLGQIKMRSRRMEIESDNLMVLSEIDAARILDAVNADPPALLIVDSIQTMLSPSLESPPGSVSQVRECAALFQRYCKAKGVPVILVGHITKSGHIAGPMVLEHIVDTVLFFEGEQVKDFRILRALKNRFGSTSEIGVFSMEATGLKEIDNPSKFFLSMHSSKISGSVVAPVIEGSRTILIEVQALVTQSGFGMPARRAEGISANRVNVLLAVMEKRGGMLLGGSDVFINVVGGVQVDEPAADLGIVLAIASSFRDRALPGRCCTIGEVGLGGEIRSVSRVRDRIQEAARMGFDRVIIPKANMKDVNDREDVELIGVEDISGALEKAFG